MKVYILFLIAFLPFEINAQTTIGVYTNNEFSLELSDPEASIVFDSIKVEFSYGGNFDSYSISDPNPYNSSSVGYLIFKGDSSGRIRTWGFLLTKSISSGCYLYD